MSDQITYDDKADLIVDTTIDDMFKVSASDMNEIKNVVNSNAQEMEENKAEVQDDIAVINNNITDLNNNKLDKNEVLNEASTDTDKPYSADYLNDKLVSVGAEAPTNGERVWFKKSVNLFDNSKIDGSNPYQATYSTSNGVVTITSNAPSGVSFCYIVPTINLKANQSYAVSFDVSGDYLRARMYDVINRTYTDLSTTIENGRAKAIFTLANDSSYRLLVYVTLNKSCEVSKVQIQEGIPTPYEPYIKPAIYVDGVKIYEMS